jgi:polyphosphate glucokinase
VVGQILAIDVGGSHVKIMLSSGGETRRFASGAELRPQEMVDGVAALSGDWSYDGISVGVPAPVHDGHVAVEPVNLGPHMVGSVSARRSGAQQLLKRSNG